MLAGKYADRSLQTLHAKIFTGPEKCNQWYEEFDRVLDALDKKGISYSETGSDKMGEIFCITLNISRKAREILKKTEIVFSTTPQFGSSKKVDIPAV